MIGSGFIGCEIAASLRMRGHRVDLVSDETAPNVARLGDEAAAVLARWLQEQGVSLHLGTAVERIERSPDGIRGRRGRQPRVRRRRDHGDWRGPAR